MILALEHVAIASGEHVFYSYVLFNAAHVNIGDVLFAAVVFGVGL